MVNGNIIKALTKINVEHIKSDYISKIGEGAWHQVYRIERGSEADLVMRLKKKIAYGQLQEFNERELKAEYESTKSFYQYANRCCEAICPNYFQYYIDSSLVFTIETYMGKGKSLLDLTNQEAFSIGKKLGSFYQKMHKLTPDINGFGNLLWNGEHLEGEVQKDVKQIWQEDNEFYLEVVEKLSARNCFSNSALVVNKITNIINKRRIESQKMVLVNQDITPENIILDTCQLAVIDPFPRLDFNIKYAAYFVFCYRFLLIAYSDAPRYKKSFYRENGSKLREMADGFLNSYTNNNKELIDKIMNEYILWILVETYEHVELLNETLSQKTLQQMGNIEMIKNRLHVCVKELENSCSLWREPKFR